MTRAAEYQVGGGIMIGSRLLTGGGLHAQGAGDRPRRGRRRRRLARFGSTPAARMQVGPDSAGAVPGPVCYDLGGDEPTVTDANVVLGYLNPDSLWSAVALKLDAERARRVFDERDRRAARPVARACGLRRASDRRLQHDPRDPRRVERARPRPARLRLVRVRRQRPAVRRRDGAARSACERVVVPPSPGLFSSFGLLYAEVEHHYSRTFRAPAPQASTSPR